MIEYKYIIIPFRNKPIATRGNPSLLIVFCLFFFSNLLSFLKKNFFSNIFYIGGFNGNASNKLTPAANALSNLASVET